MLATIQDQRLWFHSRRLEETLSANSVAVQDWVAGTAQSMGGTSAAIRSIEGNVQLQALVMTYNDIFWLLALGILIVTPLVLFLRPLPKGAPMAAAH